jgi:hypothetical protein
MQHLNFCLHYIREKSVCTVATQNNLLPIQVHGPQTELSGMQFLAIIYNSEPGHYVNHQSGCNVYRLSMSYNNCRATSSFQRVGQMKWKYANFKHIPKQHSNNTSI